MNHAYRGAVALNNVGCSLMQQGCHCQARATFQDSILLLKVASTAAAAGDDYKGSICIQHNKVDTLVQHAMRRLATPRRDTKDIGRFVTISDDACCSTSLKELGQGSSRFTQAILIRIEDYGRQNHSERDMEVDSCLVLQNYAVSLLNTRAAASKERTKQSAATAAGSRNKQPKVASRLLRLCLDMLSRRYQQTMAAAATTTATTTCIPLDLAQSHRMIAAAYVATYSLVQATLAGREYASSSMAFMTAHSGCCRRLQSLYSRLQVLDAPGSSDQCAAAA